jgi:hypothetical protein
MNAEIGHQQRLFKSRPGIDRCVLVSSSEWKEVSVPVGRMAGYCGSLIRVRRLFIHREIEIVAGMRGFRPTRSVIYLSLPTTLREERRVQEPRQCIILDYPAIW